VGCGMRQQGCCALGMGARLPVPAITKCNFDVTCGVKSKAPPRLQDTTCKFSVYVKRFLLHVKN
jgi:hypothetical protein